MGRAPLVPGAPVRVQHQAPECGRPALPGLRVSSSCPAPDQLDPLKTPLSRPGPILWEHLPEASSLEVLRPAWTASPAPARWGRVRAVASYPGEGGAGMGTGAESPRFPDVPRTACGVQAGEMEAHGVRCHPHPRFSRFANRACPLPMAAAAVTPRPVLGGYCRAVCFLQPTSLMGRLHFLNGKSCDCSAGSALAKRPSCLAVWPRTPRGKARQ